MKRFLQTCALLFAGWLATETVVRAELLDNPFQRPVVIDKETKLPALNRRLLETLEASLGKRRGNGQCAGMVDWAFDQIQAKDYSPRTDTGKNDDYVWGSLVCIVTPGQLPTARVLPGDVIQWRDAGFEGKLPKGNGTYTSGSAHHTAVISSVKGYNWYLLQQNVGNKDRPVVEKEKVQGGLLFLPDMKKGTIWVYRPAAPGGLNLTGDNPKKEEGKLQIDEGSISLFKSNLKPNDKITYFIEFPANKPAFVKFKGNSGADVDLFIRTNKGQMVTSETGRTDVGRLSWTPPTTQVYQVELRNVGDKANMVAVTHNGKKQPEVIGETSDTSKPQPTQTLNVSRAIVLPAKKDFSFNIDLVAGKSVKVWANGTGKTDVDLFIYDPKGQQIKADLRGTDACEIVFTPNAAGSYRVRLNNLGNDANRMEIRATYVVTK